MSWVLAFLGFALLIILHEAGHFVAAKAVGMRVERFSLFFGRTPLRFHRGETEYGIGWIPLGGFVKISGMSPREELPPEVEERAFYRQPVWKRIVVIAAGPAVNIVLAFLILWVLVAATGRAETSNRVAAGGLQPPALTVLKPNDEIVAVDGVRGGPERLRAQIATHRCAGPPRDGCAAAEPASVEVLRGGRPQRFDIRPRYDAANRRPRLGFTYGQRTIDVGAGAAASQAVSVMGDVTSQTVSKIARIFDAKERKQLSGVIGGYEATRQSFEFSSKQAIFILGLISLSLAIVNLFPFLPLDGGHIFWALAEKVRRRPVPFWVMERASLVGIGLVLVIAYIGLSNDIGRLTSPEGFHIPR